MSLLERSLPLFGSENIEKLASSSVIVFGAGGVGSSAIEFLARCGIGRIGIVDGDTVSDSNRNRQLIALVSTIGKSKASVAAERVRDINPDCTVDVYDLFFDEKSECRIPFAEYGFIEDCIDTVTSKLLLAVKAKELDVPIISAMGTGNRLDMTKVKVKDIYETSGCPLARVMRRELRARGIEKLKVVCSDEIPGKVCEGRNENGRAVPSSACFVPAEAGMRMAYETVKEILKWGK